MRPSWPHYFMSLARVVATRATCPRRQVGCVLVVDKQVRSSGYNGSPPGQLHCTDDECLMIDGHCVRTVHAEINAVAQAARHGTRLDGATAYTTVQPCWSCLKVLASAGVERVVYEEPYGGEYPAESPIWNLELLNHQPLSERIPQGPRKPISISDFNDIMKTVWKK